MVKILRSSILAGIYIGTAGFGFLAATSQTQYGSLVGAILFALGLLAIVGYKLKLFTGTAGWRGCTEDSLYGVGKRRRKCH